MQAVLQQWNEQLALFFKRKTSNLSGLKAVTPTTFANPNPNQLVHFSSVQNKQLEQFRSSENSNPPRESSTQRQSAAVFVWVLLADSYFLDRYFFPRKWSAKPAKNIKGNVYDMKTSPYAKTKWANLEQFLFFPIYVLLSIVFNQAL